MIFQRLQSVVCGDFLAEGYARIINLASFNNLFLTIASCFRDMLET